MQAPGDFSTVIVQAPSIGLQHCLYSELIQAPRDFSTVTVQAPFCRTSALLML